MRILVCGGRDYGDEQHMAAVLAEHCGAAESCLIIEGGSTGADALARHWALENGVANRTFAIDRSQGSAAGPIRNQRMIEVGRPDIVIAFPGGAGTEDVIRRARAAGMTILDFRAYASSSSDRKGLSPNAIAR